MEGAGGHGVTSPLRPGIIAAVATLLIDQASKLWLLYVFDLGHRGAVQVTPFFDLVLAWNIGISFGWLQNDSQVVQFAPDGGQGAGRGRAGDLDGPLADPARHHCPGIDHRRGDRQRASTASPMARWSILPCSTSRSAEIPINWYVFNLADMAIVAGVVALLYDSFLGVPAAKAP